MITVNFKNFACGILLSQGRGKTHLTEFPIYRMADLSASLLIKAGDEELCNLLGY